MKPAYPVEVRRSAWEIWLPLAFSVAAAGFAVQQLLMPAPPGAPDLLPVPMILVAAAFFAAFLFMRAERLILHSDRIERIDLLGRTVRRRDEVTGYRAVQGQAMVFGPPGGWRMSIPGHAFKNPAWRAWIESCRNLNAVEVSEALRVAEVDPSLGHSVADRHQAIENRRKVTLAVTAAMAGLFFWTIIWPRPSGLPLYLSSAAPFVAIALVGLKREVFSILSDNRPSTRIDLSMMIFGATGPAIVALKLPLADWLPPLLVAALIGGATAVLMLNFAMAAAQRHWLIGTMVGVAIFASSWGGLLALNQALDNRAPMLVSATVTGSRWRDGSPKLSVEVGGPRPFRMTEVAVSKLTSQAVGAGAPLCAGVYPGRVGWRSVRLVKCEAVVRLPASPRL